MTKVVKPVSEMYFGQQIGNTQDPDEPWDARGKTSIDGFKLAGRGAQGGGSKPTPQAKQMKRGSAGGKGTRPKSPQRLRG